MKISKKNLKIFSSPGFVLLYFLILTLAVTYPLVFHLRSNIAGYHDAWQFVWNFWWLKTALLKEHTSPLFTNYLHYPNGISLLFHTLSLTNSLIALPLQFIFGLVTTYNLLIILSFVLTGFSTYCLAQYLTKNRFASFIAGIIVAFSPYMITHSYGHLNLLSFEWIPFFILYFIKMIKKEGGWIGPALFIVLTGLTDWYYFFYLGIFMLLYLIYLLMAERKLIITWNFLKNFLLMLLSSLLILSPYLGQMIYRVLKDANFQVEGHNPILYSNDLIAFVIPSYTSKFAQYFSHFWQNFPAYWESVAFIGFSVIALIIFAVAFVRKKEVYFWFACIIFFAILSLGPYLYIEGHLYKNIILPYYYLEKLPFMKIQGVPARFAIMVYLSGGILVSYCISFILKKRSYSRFIIVVLLSAIIIFEYLPAAYFLSRIPAEEFYQKIGQDKENYVVLDRSAEDSKILYYQTIHGKRLIGGYTSRPTNQTTDFINSTPVISNIYNGVESDLLNQESVAVLKKYQIKYIILYSWDRSRGRMMDQIKLPQIYKSAWIKVYEVK